MRTVVLRVVALALLLLLTLVAIIALRTTQRLPDTVIYYVRANERTFTLEAVNRRLGRLDPAERAKRQVEELTRGPNAAEAAKGLSTLVPGGSAVRSALLTDGVLTVDLTGEFAQGGGSASMIGRLTQLFYTLTQPRDVSAVVLELDGKPVETFSAEGLIVPNPWVRAEHPSAPEW